MAQQNNRPQSNLLSRVAITPAMGEEYHTRKQRHIHAVTTSQHSAVHLYRSGLVGAVRELPVPVLPLLLN
jgi:hypothetical protein